MKNHGAPPLPNDNRRSIEEAMIRVLFVDDETSFLNSAKQILELLGSFHVETASSVNEALQKMKDKMFDVIVSDYQMPEKNGLDFLRELRESGNDIPFILFTGKGREEVAIKALNLGADRYFNKIGHPETVYGELSHGIRQTVAQRKAKQEIWDREEELRAILASSPDAMIVTDLHGNVTDCNLETLNLLGVSSKKDILGKDCYTFLVKQDRKHVIAAVNGLFEHGFINNLECRLLTKSGCRIPVEFSANILKDAYGNPVGAVCLARNITDHKQMEWELKKSEEKYRGMVEQAPDSIMTFDLNGVVTSCNPVGLEITGLSEDEIIGKHFSELSPIFKEDIPKLLKMFGSLLDGKALEPFEVSYSNKNGMPSSGEVHVSLMKEGNKITGFQAIVRDITEHKKAVEELRESEKRFRELSELLPEVIFEMDSKGVLRFVNHEAYVRFGYSREEFDKGLNAVQMLVPEDRDRAEENIGKVLRGEKIGSNEYMAMRKDGGKFPIIIKSAPIIRGDKSVGLRGVMVDITEHKKAEDELRESEEKFRTLAEQSPNMIFINQEGRIVYANRKCEELMGYSREEFCSPDFNFFTLISPEYVEQIKSSFSMHLKCEEVPSCEYSLITKEGKRIEAILTTKLITYQGKNAILGTITDITERKQMENAIREGEEKLRTLLDTANVLVQSVDANGSFVYVNKEWMKILGYSGEDFKKLTLMDIIRSDYRKHCMDTFKQVMNGEAVSDIEAVFVSKDGNEIRVRGNAKPIFRDGKFISTVGLFLDVTERKKAEEALNETLTKLATLNEKLGVVGKLTRHDARNKLSVIANNIYIAKNQLDANHAALEYLGAIESAVEQMEKIFGFARVYEMLGAEELSYVDVKKSVDEAVTLFSGSDGKKFVNECDGLIVLADSLLRQVFYNLIDNSLKHGEKVAQIRVRYKEGKDDLKIVYEDDGVGIAEADKENIFKEGYGKGTGYGLYLINKTCEAYSWAIKETGVPGKGAQFTITVPKAAKNGKMSYIVN